MTHAPSSPSHQPGSSGPSDSTALRIPPTLVVRASGGLSNRLQAVVAGIAFCLLSGRALCVDWRDGMYSDDFSNVFPQWFTVRGVQSIAVEDVLAHAAARPDAVHPPFWQGRIADAVTVEHFFDNDHLSPANVARSSTDWACPDESRAVENCPDENCADKTRQGCSSLVAHAPLLVAWAWDWKPALALAPRLRATLPDFAGLTDREIIYRLTREYLVPAPDLVAEADAFAAAHFAPRTVGIHIRHTDLQSPLDLMLAALRAVAAPDDTVFLATDNAHVERAVQRLFPRTISRSKYFSPVGEPLHSWVPGVSNVAKGRDALLDMLLLARCGHIIHYARSSFARLPIALSGLSDAHIHAV